MSQRRAFIVAADVDALTVAQDLKFAHDMPELPRVVEITDIFDDIVSLGSGAGILEKCSDDLRRRLENYELDQQEQLPPTPTSQEEEGAQKSEEGAGGVAGPRFDPRELYEWAFDFSNIRMGGDDHPRRGQFCHDRAIDFVRAVFGGAS